MAAFVLIHSPLVGPLTWSLVAEELRQQGRKTLLPHLRNEARDNRPYWQQHGEIVAELVRTLPSGEPVVLVGHSGAGVLLPAAAQMCGQETAGSRKIAAYIFVDAGLPAGDASRFDLFGSSEDVEKFKGAAEDGYLPVWTSEDLRDVIEDPSQRERFVEELKPAPVALYEEITPVFDAWPDAPCGYLHFSAFYELSLAHARRARWAVEELPGGHFEMLNRPQEVAQVLAEMVKNLGD